MKTIKEVIEESTTLTERLLSENPGMSSITFDFQDFPLDEVRAYADAHDERVEFSPVFHRFGFIVAPSPYHTYIHIRSVEVKAKLVYEEVVEEVPAINP